MNLLVRINQITGRTVIVVTHEKELVNHFNKRVVMIENGEIVADKSGGYGNAQEI